MTIRDRISPENARKLVVILGKQVRARTCLSTEERTEAVNRIVREAEGRLNLCRDGLMSGGTKHVTDHPFRSPRLPKRDPANTICAICGDWLNHHRANEE